MDLAPKSTQKSVIGWGDNWIYTMAGTAKYDADRRL